MVLAPKVIVIVTRSASRSEVGGTNLPLLMEHPELQDVWDDLLGSNTGEDIFLKNSRLFTGIPPDSNEVGRAPPVTGPEMGCAPPVWRHRGGEPSA